MSSCIDDVRSLHLMHMGTAAGNSIWAMDIEPKLMIKFGEHLTNESKEMR